MTARKSSESKRGVSSPLKKGRRGPELSEKLVALHQHAAKLSSDNTSADIFSHTLDAMKYALGYDQAGVTAVEEDWLMVKAYRGSKRDYPDLRLDGPGVMVKAANKKRSILVPDTRKEVAYVQGKGGMLSELAVPIILDGETVGVLNVESTRLNSFNDEDRMLLETLASHVSSCLGRVRGEESLRSSETKMRAILEGFPGLVFELNEHGVFTDYFAGSKAELAYLPEDFIGKHVGDVFPPKVARVYQSAMRAARRARNVRAAEYQLPMLDGRMADWEARFSPSRGKGYTVVVNNITERRRADEKLRQSEERYRSLVDGMLDGTYRSTHHGRFVDVNPAFVRMFGYSSKQEMLDIRSISDALYFSQEDRASLFLDTGQEKVEVFRMRRKDGSEIWVEDHGRYVHDSKGNVIYHEGVLRDVTERVQAEAALRESEKRYRDLVEMSPDAVAVHDGKKVVFVNPAAAKLLGVGEPGKAVGLEMIRFVHPDSRPQVASQINEMLTSWKESPLAEEKFLRLDGSPLDVEVAAMPVTWHGAPAVQVTFRDITERRLIADERKRYSEHLEEQVEERTAKLREAERMAAMGQLASMVAHDLRNPLTGISGAVYYLKKKYGSTSDRKTREMLEVIENDVEYSNNMMTGLVEYSGEIRLDVVDADPKSIVEKALSLVRIPENVRVSNQTRDEPKAKVDVDKMTRVSVNIIQNAIEAMPRGGKLTISSHEAGRNLKLQFADTGEGIKEEAMSRIWVPFSTTKAKGMGLGLPMAKQIVEAHGGSISIETTPRKGTTVTVTVPAKPNANGGESK